MSVRALTKKQFEQQAINESCEKVYYDFLDDYNVSDPAYKRLRSCQARVYETDNFYALESYDTFVAVIRKSDMVIVDVLRFVFGYTNTSAQHITKFIHDYTAYPWNRPRLTWRNINKI